MKTLTNGKQFVVYVFDDIVIKEDKGGSLTPDLKQIERISRKVSKKINAILPCIAVNKYLIQYKAAGEWCEDLYKRDKQLWRTKVLPELKQVQNILRKMGYQLTDLGMTDMFWDNGRLQIVDLGRLRPIGKIK